MIIKHQDVVFSLQKKLYPLYILTGQDNYLLNDAATLIKQAWKQRGECDEKTLQLNLAADWASLEEEANSYSLFSEYVLLDARCDKKTIDAQGKKILQHYLQNINPRCLIILRAPDVPNKQLQLLASNEHTVLVQAYPLPAQALQRWITTQLTSKKLRYAASVPGLIHQYTQGNMLACAQVIEKLALVSDENEIIDENTVKEHLSDQCDYQLYELAEACLNGNAEKAILMLRQACENRTEPTLILWLLSQEIRLLIQLSHLRKQSVSLTTACSQLKIWPQRASVYEKTINRLSIDRLHQLLHIAQQLDEQIKSNQRISIWQGFEALALQICTGHFYSTL